MDSIIISYKNNLLSSLLQVDRVAVRKLVVEAKEQFSLGTVIEELISPVMTNIGDQWATGTVSLSQLYMSGRLVEDLLVTLFPSTEIQFKKHPPIASAVLLDFHVLGKRIVDNSMRVAGYKVQDFGSGITVDKLVQQTIENDIEVLLLSVLMLPSAFRVGDVKAKLQEAGKDVKICVGGAPFRFDKNLWKEVNADVMGESATDAVAIVQKLLKG